MSLCAVISSKVSLVGRNDGPACEQSLKAAEMRTDTGELQQSFERLVG